MLSQLDELIRQTKFYPIGLHVLDRGVVIDSADVQVLTVQWHHVPRYDWYDCYLFGRTTEPLNVKSGCVMVWVHPDNPMYDKLDGLDFAMAAHGVLIPARYPIHLGVRVTREWLEDTVDWLTIGPLGGIITP